MTPDDLVPVELSVAVASTRRPRAIYRLWEHLWIEPDTGCWIWTGSINENGYGRISVDRKFTYTHRLSFVLHVGSIPDDKLVLHNCPHGANALCCNPLHLYLGDHKQNTADMIREGRQKFWGSLKRRRGEHHPNSKYSEQQVIKMLKLCRDKNLTHKELARRSGLSVDVVHDILRGKTWKHLTKQLLNC